VNRTKLQLIAIISLGIATVALALDATSDFKAYLAKLEPQVEKAFKNKNAAFFQQVSTPDFKYVDAQGNVENKEQSMASMKQMFGMAKSVSAKFKRLSATAKGNQGTASYEGKFNIVMAGPDGKMQNMAMSTYTRETYRKVGSKWLVSKIQETKPGKMTMNGKPFNPGPPPSKGG
jgi:hypothetical protein